MGASDPGPRPIEFEPFAGAPEGDAPLPLNTPTAVAAPLPLRADGDGPKMPRLLLPPSGVPEGGVRALSSDPRGPKAPGCEPISDWDPYEA
ncbi:hypothetical protein TGP89_420530 [Toxoplasma gondii p89]|uniref:Uncharacterized protein n=1 Tax=Toxoplasma gondii p89 TaxID=943119 RepID=A0A086JKS9_TOXGO|nr:hypothetical protein TGP89_420530 [Toxoplasma gondii p89]